MTRIRTRGRRRAAQVLSTLERAVGSRGVWTIDLVHLLAAHGVPGVFCTGAQGIKVHRIARVW